MHGTQNLGIELEGDDKNFILFGYSDASYLPHSIETVRLLLLFE
jgi:hypothetical protein